MNIEHSVAKSWWGGTNNNAYKDLYHLNPSDATANSARSNYPLGINNGSKFDNGSIKVGNNTYSTEYSGLCFEPLDEYKGDFARAYMYMFTCYEDLSWTGTNAPTMLNANETWPMLKPWAKDLLLTWSR
jgi:endonuclease I